MYGTTLQSTASPGQGAGGIFIVNQMSRCRGRTLGTLALGHWSEWLLIPGPPASVTRVQKSVSFCNLIPHTTSSGAARQFSLVALPSDCHNRVLHRVAFPACVWGAVPERTALSGAFQAAEFGSFLVTTE